MIRAPLEDLVIVQGGPGTGKTAVGLHRAAFLLYEHRELLERQRLLVVGPNQIFLRYIAQVLPSLGETAVMQATIETLMAGRYPVRATDRPGRGGAQGGSRACTRCCDARCAIASSRPRDDVAHRHRLRIGSSPGRRDRRARRHRVRARAAVERPAGVVPRAVGAPGLAALRGPPRRRPRRPAVVRGQPPRRAATSRRLLDRTWPSLRASVAACAACWATVAVLADAAAGVLEPDEQALLAATQHRSRRRRTLDARRPRAAGRGRGAHHRHACHLWPRRRGRGAGPDRDGAAPAGPAHARALDDRARRPGAGHRRGRADQLG